MTIEKSDNNLSEVENIDATNGNVTITGGTTVGAPNDKKDIKADKVTISGDDNHIYANIHTDDDIIVKNTSVEGDIISDNGDVTVEDSTTENITSTNGGVNIKNSKTGDIIGKDDDNVEGSNTGDVTSTDGDVKVSDSNVDGDTTSEKGNVTVDKSKISGGVEADNGTSEVKDSTIQDDVSGDTVNISGDDTIIKGNVSASENLSFSDATVEGEVTGNKGNGTGITSGKFYGENCPSNSLLGVWKTYIYLTDPITGQNYWMVPKGDPEFDIYGKPGPKPNYVPECDTYEYDGSGDEEIKLSYTNNGEIATEEALETAVIKVDGQFVYEIYTIKLLSNGDISIDFSEEYIKTLSKGKHEIEIIIGGVSYKMYIVIS